MVLITEENLKIMNSRTLALARRYLKQGCLKRIVVNELEKNAIYKVEGTIQVSSYENLPLFYQCSFTFRIFYTLRMPMVF